MSVAPLLLLFGVEVLSLGIRVPNVVLVEHLPLLLLDFFHLTLSLLLQLVSKRHKQVALPDVELGLKGVVLADSREE